MATKKVLLKSQNNVKQALYLNGRLKQQSDTYPHHIANTDGATIYTISDMDEDILRIAGGFPSKLTLLHSTYSYKAPKK